MKIDERVLSSGLLSVSIECMCGRQWMVVVDNLENTVARVPVPKLEYRHHTFVWGVVTHAR